MSNVCGIDPNNFKGRCEKGVSLNSDLCEYNEKTQNCIKKSKKTWAQIEADLKSGSHKAQKVVEEIMIPVEAVAKVIEEEKAEIKGDCGIQVNPYVGKCQEGISTHTQYCKRGASGNCVKATIKTWDALKRELDVNGEAPEPIPALETKTAVDKDTRNLLFKSSPEISRQLEDYLNGIADLHEVHDLSDGDLDLLLNNIKIESGSKTSLMDYVAMIAGKESGITPQVLYNIKVKVLLDNLAKKMCRCTESDTMEGARSKVGVCRSTIFQKRGLDFFTYECLPDEKNPVRAPRLNKQKGSNKILQTYIKKKN